MKWLDFYPDFTTLKTRLNEVQTGLVLDSHDHFYRYISKIFARHELISNDIDVIDGKAVKRWNSIALRWFKAIEENKKDVNKILTSNNKNELKTANLTEDNSVEEFLNNSTTTTLTPSSLSWLYSVVSLPDIYQEIENDFKDLFALFKGSEEESGYIPSFSRKTDHIIRTVPEEGSGSNQSLINIDKEVRLGAAINGINNLIDSVRENHDDIVQIDHDVSELDDEVSENTSEINDINSEITGINTRITNVEQQVNNIEHEIQNIDTNIDTNEENIATNLNSIDGLKATTRTLTELGQVENAPTTDMDIATKKYVDDSVPANQFPLETITQNDPDEHNNGYLKKFFGDRNPIFFTRKTLISYKDSISDISAVIKNKIGKITGLFDPFKGRVSVFSLGQIFTGRDVSIRPNSVGLLPFNGITSGSISSRNFFADSSLLREKAFNPLSIVQSGYWWNFGNSASGSQYYSVKLVFPNTTNFIRNPSSIPNIDVIFEFVKSSGYGFGNYLERVKLDNIEQPSNIDPASGNPIPNELFLKIPHSFKTLISSSLRGGVRIKIQNNSPRTIVLKSNTLINFTKWQLPDLTTNNNFLFDINPNRFRFSLEPNYEGLNYNNNANISFKLQFDNGDYDLRINPDIETIPDPSTYPIAYPSLLNLFFSNWMPFQKSLWTQANRKSLT